MRSAVRVAVLVAGATLAAVAIASCTSSSGNDAAPSSKSPSASATTTSAAPDNTAGDWTLESYKLKDDGLGSFGGTARITYNGDEPYAVNTFTLTISKDGTELGTALGQVTDIDPGQTKTIQLVSTDAFVKGPYTVKFRKDT